MLQPAGQYSRGNFGSIEAAACLQATATGSRLGLVLRIDRCWFLVLTAAIGAGFVFIDDLFSQHLAGTNCADHARMVPLCRAAGPVLQARLASAIGDHRQLDRLWPGRTRFLWFQTGTRAGLAPGSVNGTSLNVGPPSVRLERLVSGAIFLQHLGPKLIL